MANDTPGSDAPPPGGPAGHGPAAHEAETSFWSRPGSASGPGAGVTGAAGSDPAADPGQQRPASGWSEAADPSAPGGERTATVAYPPAGAGQTSAGQPGAGQPGAGQPGAGQPGAGQGGRVHGSGAFAAVAPGSGGPASAGPAGDQRAGQQPQPAQYQQPQPGQYAQTGQYGPTSQTSGPGAYGGQPGPRQPGTAAQGPAPHGTGQHGGWPGSTSTAAYGTSQHAAGPPSSAPQGAGPFGTGGYPVHSGQAAPQSERRGGRGLGAIAAVGLVAALLGGGVGGAVGVSLAGGSGSGGSSGVLANPIPQADGSAPLGPVEATAARVLPSVVQLRVDGPAGAGEGSGMVLSADGLMLTNNHVVEVAANGGTVVAVFQDGSTAPARIVGRDPSSDLAVIRADGVTNLTPIELGNSDEVQVGQQVVAFGSPLGLGGTVTSGIISAVDRAVSVGADSGASEATVLNALQTDAAINPGNSGGPLTDLQGRVVGINSVIATTGEQGGSIGVGFSIPINQARRIADQLQSTGRATRAILGVSLTPTDPRALSGALLGPVQPGGPAAAAGLVEGETVTRVDDRVITGSDELIAAIRDRAPGDQVTLTVNGRQVTVTLGESTG